MADNDGSNKLCEWCKQVPVPERNEHFCSVVCQREADKLPDRLCRYCGNPIPRGDNHGRKVYCNKKCMGAARTLSTEGLLFAPGRYLETPAPPDRNMKGPCWIWQGGKNSDGYGAIKQLRDRGLPAPVHAAAYTLLRGPVPEGLELDHLCRVRACMNPDHLEAVTHHENMKRGIQATKTHCKRGHEFTPENTKVTINQCGNPGRTCIACQKLAEARRYTPHPKPPATHCIYGHAFDEENTYTLIDKNGKPHRQCRACHRDYDKNHRKRTPGRG